MFLPLLATKLGVFSLSLSLKAIFLFFAIKMVKQKVTIPVASDQKKVATKSFSANTQQLPISQKPSNSKVQKPIQSCKQHLNFVISIEFFRSVPKKEVRRKENGCSAEKL